MSDVKKTTTATHPIRTQTLNPKETAKHGEKLLDDALASTFPASDPFVEKPQAAELTPKEKIKEALLDDALEFSFPASDPISISSSYERIKNAPTMAAAKADHTSPGSKKLN